jgi:hypothetical protein
MTTLEELKKRATAAEAVLIERVEALVAGQAKQDALRKFREAIESVGVPRLDSFESVRGGENPIRAWVNRIYTKFEES